MQVFYGLLSLLSKDLQAKIKCIGAMLTVTSFEAVVWSQSTPPFPVGEIAHMRPNHGSEREYAYCHSSNREKIKNST